MTNPAPSADAKIKTVATNRKAVRDYFILDRFEAGIELLGTEVKSLRNGHVSLDESHARIQAGEVYLFNLYIPPYAHGNRFNHEPRRPRRMLLHKRQIKQLFGQSIIKGHALIPLRIYFKRGIAKVELGLCKGKHRIDKRDDLRRKTAELEARRALANRGRNK